MARCVVLFLLFASLVGCRTSPSPEAAESSPEDGLPASQLPEQLTPSGPPVPDEAPPSGTSSPPTSGQQGASSGGTFASIGSVTDPSGDSGVNSPRYADLAQVDIRDDGSLAQIIVDFYGEFPSPFPDDEVMGVGVDLFIDASQESDYQVFAAGNVEGWHAWLHTPEGVVTLPGTFFAGSSRLVFQLPWQRLGSITGRSFSAFVDWSGSAIGPVALQSSDRAPNGSRGSFQR